MKAAAIALLSVAGTLATGAAGYGLYQAGAAQAWPAAHGPAIPAESHLEARVEAAVAAALAAREPAATVPTAAAVATPPASVTATVSTTVRMDPPPAIQEQAMPARARVIRVQPHTVSWQEPREVCEWVTVQRSVPVQDDTRVARTLLGAAAGGLLGNQIGGGSGKQVATVVGALAGAQVGSRSGERERLVSTREQRCHTASETRSRQDGFLVTYEYNGVVDTVHTRREPGAYLPVDNGRVLF